jgi:DNA helicase HerA-like ATPase
MSKKEKFVEIITSGYTFKGDSITLGAAMLDGEAINGLQVKVPLRTLNRHGLIAGATGSGKTKTLQIIAEQLSAKGVPVLLMDIKGDLSGIAAPGATNPENRRAPPQNRRAVCAGYQPGGIPQPL